MCSDSERHKVFGGSFNKKGSTRRMEGGVTRSSHTHGGQQSHHTKRSAESGHTRRSSGSPSRGSPPRDSRHVPSPSRLIRSGEWGEHRDEFMRRRDRSPPLRRPPPPRHHSAPSRRPPSRHRSPDRGPRSASRIDAMFEDYWQDGERGATRERAGREYSSPSPTRGGGSPTRSSPSRSTRSSPSPNHPGRHNRGSPPGGASPPNESDIRSWLERNVHGGYADRYGAAFEALGIDDARDVQRLDENAMRAIEEQVHRAADAHVRKMRLALAAAGATVTKPPDGFAPTAGLAVSPWSSPSMGRPPASAEQHSPEEGAV